MEIAANEVFDSYRELYFEASDQALSCINF
jgi:hypothetical protein